MTRITLPPGVLVSKRERRAIASGLGDPAVRAFVIVCGVLRELPSDTARARVMTYVVDKFAEDDAAARRQG